MKLSGKVNGIQNLPAGRVPSVVLSRVHVFSSGCITMSSEGGTTFETPILPDGTFEFTKVPAGSYKMRTVPGALGFSTNIEFTDRDITDLEISIPVQRNISGRVRVDNGGPAPHGRIQFANPTLGGYYSNIQSDGSFSVRLPVGEYNVATWELPVGFAPKEIRCGDLDLLTTPLKVDAEQSSPPVEIAVTLTTIALDSIPGVRISGRTTRQIGDAAIALLSSTHPSRPSRAEVQPDGTFEFLKVLPGTYSLLLRARVHVQPPIQKVVTVADQDLTDIVLTIPPIFDIAGQVEIVNLSGESFPPPPGMGMMFRHANFMSAVGLRIDGGFGITLGEGEHMVLPRELPEGYAVKSITSGTEDLLKTPLKLSEGMPPIKEIRVVIEYMEL